MMIRGVLIDLSGTLHVGGKVIPGAVESLQRLRDAGKRIRFLTNTSTKSTSRLWQELVEMGFCNDDNTNDKMEDVLLTSVLATKEYLKNHQLRPFCIMEDVSDFVGSIELSPPHDCVVVGLAPTKLNYENLNRAFRILLTSQKNSHSDSSSSSSLSKKPKLIAIHRANFLRDVDDELSLGPGGFVTALEAATATTCHEETVVMGKPSREFFQSALWPDLKAAEEVCMIGDDILGDIQGAQRSGIGTTLLVQTGKYRAGDESKIDLPPSKVCASIVQAIDFILESEKIQPTREGNDDP